MRRNDAYLTVACDKRDLATILEFFISRGYTPRGKSEFGRVIIEQYALTLRANGHAQQVETAMEATQILDLAFGEGTFNPQGRLATGAQVNMQIDSGVSPDQIKRIRKSRQPQDNTLTLESKASIQYEKELKKLEQKAALDEAKGHLSSGRLSNMPATMALPHIKLLVENGDLNYNAIQACMAKIARDQGLKPESECTSDTVVSTDDPDERERRDREEMKKLKEGLGPGMIPGPDQMIKDS